MIEAPIFIPSGDERLAGILTLPEGHPRALVLLLQGLGAPRSHKYGLWTRTGRMLADRGIASLRMDYPTLGDSTGPFHADLNHPPVDEVIGAARRVMDILGIDAYAVVGNCLGGRTALGVAASLPGCLGVGCILPGNLEAIVPHRDGRAGRPAGSSVRRLVARIPALKRTIKRMRRAAGRLPARARFLPELATAMRSSRVLLLYLGSVDAYERLRRNLRSLADGTPDGPDRLRTALIPAGRIASFRLPITLQPKVIDAVVGWLDKTIPGASDTRGGDTPDVGSGREQVRASLRNATDGSRSGSSSAAQVP